MPIPNLDPESPGWSAVLESLEAMRMSLHDRGSAKVFAEHYARLSAAVDEATRAMGQTSLRFEAAKKALDVATTRSELEGFVGKRAQEL